LKLNYTLKGTTGPVLVFIHGFLGSHLQWNDLVPNFQEDCRLLLIDLPGHGTDSKDPVDYQISDVAQAIHHIILEQKIEKAHFIGHSMGGYIASNYATLFPSFVKSLVLINSIAGPDSDRRKTERDRSIALIKKLKSAFVSMAITNLFTPAERTLHTETIASMKKQGHDLTQQTVVRAILAMRDRPGSLEQLKALNVPILYIYSPADVIVHEAVVQEEVRLLSSLAVSLNAGHMSILTHPAAIASILKERIVAIP
jgi:pimeloyl-ACP methyl ester carboxylesterase